MDWVANDDNTNLTDAPRLLTPEEITFIVSHIPYPPAADRDSSEMARNCIVSHISRQLAEVKLCPSRISNFIQYMVRTHIASLAIPGTAIGCNAAEALGATTTQMTLNSVAPWEQIFVVKDGVPAIVNIGPWIDEIMARNSSSIVHYPENRTEYCPLASPAYICSPTDNGSLKWNIITAVTRHDPVGKLINIQTYMGRSVTVSASKSLLVWDGTQLQPIDGDKAQVGDRVPIIGRLPAIEDIPNITIANDSRDFGLLFGIYMSCKYRNHQPQFSDQMTMRLQEICQQYGTEWSEKFFTSDLCRKFDQITTTNDSLMFFNSKDFLAGVIDGYLAHNFKFTNNTITVIGFVEAIEYLSFCCSQLGLVGKMSYIDNADCKFSIDLFNIRTWVSYDNNINEITFSDDYDELSWQKDIVLDEITQIRSITPCKVYDLTVPETANFSLFNGLCVRDTFHTSGQQKSVSSGIDAMKSLIFAGQKNRNEACTIYFKNTQLTFQQVLDHRHILVGSMVADFVKNQKIGYLSEMDKFWWHESFELLHGKKIPESTMVMRLYLNLDNMYKQHVKISDIAKVLENEVPSSIICVYGPLSDAILDIYPDPKTIVGTLNSSAKLKRKRRDNKDHDDNDELEVKQFFGNLNMDFAEKVFLESIVLQDLKNIKVKGITGIKEIYPISQPVLSIVLSERRIADIDLVNVDVTKMLRPYMQNGHVLFYNNEVIRLTGIMPENLAALCAAAGFTIIGGTDDRLYVGSPADCYANKNGDILLNNKGKWYRKLDVSKLLTMEDGDNIIYYYQSNTINDGQETFDEGLTVDVEVENFNGKLYRYVEVFEINGEKYELLDMKGLEVKQLKVSEYILKRILRDKRERVVEVNRLLAERKARADAAPVYERNKIISTPVVVEKSKLVEASGFIYAVTEGSNLRKLLTMPGIDTNRTTCNNMHKIYETFGIEAAQTFIVREFNNILSNNGSYVNPAHIEMVATFMTSRGVPAGATYSGISRQPIGHVTLATVERAAGVFAFNALANASENSNNTSAAIVLGTRMAIGSGSIDVAQDTMEGGVSKTVINDDVFLVNSNQNDDAEFNLEEELGLLDTEITDFDNVGDEESTNLLTVYQNDNADVSKLKTTNTIGKNIRQAAKNIEVPDDFMDMLDSIKTGVAQDNVPIRGTTVAITTTFKSTGLVTIDGIEIPVFDESVLNEQLETLLGSYQNAVGALSGYTRELPSVDIEQLPNLEGFDFQTDRIMNRAQQLSGLEPVTSDDM